MGLSDTELEGFRQHGEQLRRRAFASVGYGLPGGTTLRLDLGYVHSEENLPGALTQTGDGPEPAPAQPGPRAISRKGATTTTRRGALTIRTPLGDNQALEWSTQLNYQDLNHPLSFAVIDDTTYS